MRKTLGDVPELTEEDLATEMIELTCEDLDSLTRAFNMITELCDQLKEEVAAESMIQIPENQVN
jgi:hypothetical protein